jgi:RNA polymerase sigma-70 factor (sigma-E family)
MRTEAEQQYGDYVAARAPRLVRFAFLLCGDWHRAEDVVQSALVKLYLAWPRLRRVEAIDPYVRRIIVRVLVDHGRLASFRREVVHERLPEPPPAGDGSDAVTDRMALLSALAALPARQRAAVVLRFWEDQSVEQTAEALACSVGNVKSQTARGLQTLRRLLSDQYLLPTGGTDHG